jgi:hypothetical protein
MPQQYNNFLASCWQQFGSVCLQPTLDLTQDFGANDPVKIAQAAYNQGCTATSIWHYGTAVANSTLLDQILSAFPKTAGETPTMIDLTNPTVASHFEATSDPQVWHCKDKNHDFLVGHGILGFYQKIGGDALCGLTYLGLPCSNEIAVPGKPGVVKQEFERACVEWDPNKNDDNPPGSGPVYLIHVERDPRIIALQTQITTLQGEIAALKALPIVANMQQIQTIGQTIKDDVDTIMKLAQVQ